MNVGDLYCSQTLPNGQEFLCNLWLIFFGIVILGDGQEWPDIHKAYIGPPQDYKWDWNTQKIQNHTMMPFEHLKRQIVEFLVSDPNSFLCFNDE